MSSSTSTRASSGTISRRQGQGGQRRIECGSNYARLMAAFALLLAYSGFDFDAVRGHVGFSPKVADTPFTAFWSLGSGWCVCTTLDETEIRLQVESGELALASFASNRLGNAGGSAVTGVRVGGVEVAFEPDGSTLTFPSRVTAFPSQALVVSLTAAI